jgi:beta-lactam-binding protein with PASTA domain
MTWLLLLLLYAAPQRMVVVPRVIGLTVPRAEATLADAGLKLGEVKEVDDREAPRGIVIGQGPGPGQRLRINFEVRVYVVCIF